MARHRDREGVRVPWWMGLVAGALVGSLGVFLAVGGLPARSSGQEPTSSPSPSDPLAGCLTRSEVRVVSPSVLVPLLNEAAVATCTVLDLTTADGRPGVRAGEDTDLWLTDSSLWAAARTEDPGTPVSVASSPIVGSAASDLAAELGGQVVWSDLLDPERDYQLGLHDPAATATGLLAAWPILKAQRDVSDVPYTALALTAGTLSQPSIVGTQALASPPSRTLVFSGEYAAVPSVDVTVMRGAPAEAWLDFPAYNVATDAAVRAAVDRLVASMASPDLADVRAETRLRDADHTASFDTDGLGEPTRAMQPPSPGTTLKLFGLGASGNIPGRLLVALDVSASMAAVQPDGRPLLDSVRDTALVAMQTLQDHTSVGVWLFGTGTADHTELTPIRPLGEGREEIVSRVRATATSGSGTASLYPTVLDGYRALQRDFDPDAAQSLVIFTDGRSPDPSGMTVDGLVRRLKALEDPDRRIRVMGIGFGKNARVGPLKQISSEMGGASAHVDGPVQMLGVFITMIGQVAAEG